MARDGDKPMSVNKAAGLASASRQRPSAEAGTSDSGHLNVNLTGPDSPPPPKPGSCICIAWPVKSLVIIGKSSI